MTFDFTYECAMAAARTGRLYRARTIAEDKNLRAARGGVEALSEGSPKPFPGNGAD